MASKPSFCMVYYVGEQAFKDSFPICFIASLRNAQMADFWERGRGQLLELIFGEISMIGILGLALVPSYWSIPMREGCHEQLVWRSSKNCQLLGQVILLFILCSCLFPLRKCGPQSSFLSLFLCLGDGVGENTHDGSAYEGTLVFWQLVLPLQALWVSMIYLFIVDCPVVYNLCHPFCLESPGCAALVAGGFCYWTVSHQVSFVGRS